MQHPPEGATGELSHCNHRRVEREHKSKERAAAAAAPASASAAFVLIHRTPAVAVGAIGSILGAPDGGDRPGGRVNAPSKRWEVRSGLTLHSLRQFLLAADLHSRRISNV